MFDTNSDVLGEEDCFDPAWLDEAAWLNDASRSQEIDQPPMSACAPSGWLALELDQGCADPAGLSDTELIDAVIGFDRVASWAGARQAVLLAEFATSEHNLHASCRRHHRLKTHAPGWDVDQHPDGRIIWTDPTGHTHTSHPHDHRPDPHPPPDEDPPPF